MSKVIILTGQTATGKTERALELASQYNGELINCDSRQIYKHLDIISGKDLTDNTYTEVEKLNEYSIGYYLYQKSPYKGIPLPSVKLWLYDIINPKTSFSAFDYEQCSLNLVKKLLNQGKTPILVGGTYFYIQSLLYDRVTNDVAPNIELRNELATKSVIELQEKLKQINEPLFESLNESERQNPHRLIRKIEISLTHADYTEERRPTQITLSKKLNQEIEIEYIGFRYKDKDSENKLIDSRIDRRLKEDAFGEVENLLKMGFSETDPGMNTIGYQQIMQYLKRELTKEETIEKWKIKEMQYAKQQFTFMKKDLNIKWTEV